MLHPRMVWILYLMQFFTGGLQIREKPLDKAVTSFDDQYNGCVDTMEVKAKELQSTELANHEEYDRVWKEAASKWSSGSVPGGLKPEYATAVVAYTKSKGNLFRQLNEAVQTAGESTHNYLKNFQFKSFHFLLTRALQVLRAGGKCSTTYRGIKDIHLITKRFEEVRFGYFASSSLKEDVATRFGMATLLTIYTCYGAYIKEFSDYPYQEEVLIPPYELFRVDGFQKTPLGIRIHLTSIGIDSNYNCVYVKGGGVRLLHADVWIPFLFWGFLLMAGPLGAPGLF